MEPCADVAEHFLLWSGIHFAFCHPAGTPVDDLVPLCFGVWLHSVVETGNQLAGQKGAILFRQSQHLGHFLSSDALMVFLRRGQVCPNRFIQIS